MTAGRRFDNDIGVSMSSIGKLRPDGRKHYQKGYHAHQQEESVWIAAGYRHDWKMLREFLDGIRRTHKLSDNLSICQSSSVTSQRAEYVPKNPHSQNDL